MPIVRLERRLAAIMAADIVGYSRLIEANEGETLAAIALLRTQVIDPLFAEYKGRVVKLMGDGVIVEFGSVVDAVLCAVAVQRQVATNQQEVGAERRIIFRVGINLGDVVVSGDDLLGDGVNVAARLEQLSPPGGVLVSGTAYDQLRGKLDLPLDFAGVQRVKNISQPVRTYSARMEGAKPAWQLRARGLRRYLPLALAVIASLVAVGAGAWWLWPMQPVLDAKPAIAVLPFDNIGRDETTGRFADGITEDIITDLARYREVDAIAHNSTAVYKGKPVDIRQIGRDLNVRYVLEGSVQRQGGQIRINAQLLDARTAANIWSHRWDRPLEDLFAVQTEISDEVTNRLVGSKGAVIAFESVAARRARPKDLTAYEIFLRGREANYRYTKESVGEAIPLLKLAVEKDPTLARAWAELAGAYNASIDFGAKPVAARAKSLRAAQRAVALDPMDAFAHALLAHVLGMQGELQRSKAEFETALKLNPGSADIMMIYTTWASTLEGSEHGGPQRAAELVDRLKRLNPNYPSWAATPFSFVYVMAERYADALSVLERQSTENYNVYSWISGSVSNAMLDRPDETKLWVERTLKQHPDLTIEGFLSTPDWADADRQYLARLMREAGFPACAKPEQLKELEKPHRLPECASATAAP